MLVTDPGTFLAEYSPERYPVRAPETARAAFLVSPAADRLAAESATDNCYMDLDASLDPGRARRQHAQLARRLGADLPVVTFSGEPDSPDGMFPNNVFGTVRGRLIVGRMRHPVRQDEAERADIRAFFRDLLGYRIVDLSHAPYVAELTGALVIDRARGIGYCGLSERCDLDGARAMHSAFGLALTFAFELAAGEYHANVALAILAGRLALLAPDAFRDREVPAAISRVYEGSTIELSTTQKRAYACNAISLAAGRVWMSTRAADALEPDQRALIERCGFVLGTVDFDEIEKSGGSVRCCVAEIF